MRTSFKVLFFIRSYKTHTNGEAAISIRVTVNNQRAEWSTQRECDAASWNAKACRVKGNTKEVKSINAWLEQLNARAYEAQRELFAAGKEITAIAIRNLIKGIVEEEKVHTLVEVFEYHNDQFRSLVGKEFSYGTYQRFKTVLKSLKSFIKWKYTVDDVPIADINHQFITEYEFYLKTVQAVQHNTAMANIKKLKKIVRLCVANDWLAKDPFRSFKITTRETHRAYLSEHELEQLIAKHFSVERLDIVKDMFLFSCFTGLAYSDLVKLTRADLAIGIDREVWIQTTRTKTDTLSRIPLLPHALQILEKYEDHPKAVSEEKLFPSLTNQRMNSYLKEIADCLGINKELTFHCARHTFATTVTLTNGVPIETVSKMLGHRSLRTTQQYAKVLDNKVSNDMKVLKDMYALKENKKVS